MVCSTVPALGFSFQGCLHTQTTERRVHIGTTLGTTLHKGKLGWNPGNLQIGKQQRTDDCVGATGPQRGLLWLGGRSAPNTPLKGLQGSDPDPQMPLYYLQGKWSQTSQMTAWKGALLAGGNGLVKRGSPRLRGSLVGVCANSDPRASVLLSY